MDSKYFLAVVLEINHLWAISLRIFTPEEDLLYTSIAVLQIFDRIGDRKNMARNRMRYLVNENGMG